MISSDLEFVRDAIIWPLNAISMDAFLGKTGADNIYYAGLRDFVIDQQRLTDGESLPTSSPVGYSYNRVRGAV